MGSVPSVQSHLARSISPRYPAVRRAIAWALVGGLAAIGLGLRSGAGLSDATGRAVNLTVATFLGWAIARELDPDDPAGATIAAGLTVPLIWWLGPAALAPLAALLIATRLLARTTGAAPTAIDQVGLIALAAWSARSTVGWVVALGLAFATARDVRLPGPTSRLQLITALAIAIAATMRRLLAGGESAEPWTVPLLVVAAIGLLAGAGLRLRMPLTSVGDRTGDPLDERRIRSARRHAVSIAALAALAGGAPAMIGLAPALAAFGATRLRQEHN